MERNPIWFPLLATIALPLVGALGWETYKTKQESAAQAQQALAQQQAQQQYQQQLINKVRMEAMLQQMTPLLLLSIPVMLGGAYYLHLKREREGYER